MAAARGSPDRSDPKLAHLDGLNLSRAWMLEGIAAGLPSGDKRLPAIKAAAEAHHARVWRQSQVSIMRAATGWEVLRSIWSPGEESLPTSSHGNNDRQATAFNRSSF